MRAQTGTTSVVAALSVVVAAVGHVLAGGGGVPLPVLPPLLALTAACWLLGEYLADEPVLIALVLGGVQLFVHVTLDAAHHPMPMSAGLGGSVLMTLTHLAVLGAGVLAVGFAHEWGRRVVAILARLLPVRPVVRRVPATTVVPVMPASVAAWAQRWWIGSAVSWRGPPGRGVQPALF
ncbi:hypothetical protein HPO96_29065 [Kribbella sandramycini]|uniref:Uncharacterized protein n=1 Tax=Kribbella sandramycini TaxID=60450 RepID=A0A7Y4L6G6_9ACTN|nr:hypothetical protein [Kribbella sandramycini]MBB6571662.1 hypothetical protein [Kribbella sandramycini]NOL44307.1 hypothetical protein [Kribbella sandramycini]